MDEETGTGQDHARTRLQAARADIRRERGEVMARIGRELHAWRERSGILQQNLAADGWVSATVVRRIEKGDYESAPPGSLIAAIARHHGPAGAIQELTDAFRDLQARQKKIDTLLALKIVPRRARWPWDEDAGQSDALRAFPAALTSFIGREGAVGEVTGLLSGRRLVTVTGPGGSGKTRLAAEVARRTAGKFANGVRLVELAPVADPALVPSAVAAALGVREQPGMPAVEAVTRVLARQRLLLVLDNCVHVVRAAAELCAGLLPGW